MTKKKRKRRTYTLAIETVAVLESVPGDASRVIDRAIARLRMEVDQAIEDLRAAGWTDERILQAVEAGHGATPTATASAWRALAVIGGEPLAGARLGGGGG